MPMYSAGGLPLNDISQLSDMYSIVENVRCFYHIELGAVITDKERLRTAQATFAGKIEFRKRQEFLGSIELFGI